MQVDLISFGLGLLLGYVSGYLTGRAQLGARAFKARSFRPETPEERIDKAAKRVERHWSQGTIEEGAAQLQRYYEAEGLAVPSMEDARAQAKELLNASVQGETTVD